MSEVKPTITLHWLEASRSHRILWLLEELGVEYELKLYHRDEGKLADPALKKIHPLGKSPLVEIDHHDGKPPTVLAESGHIASYLVSNFDYNGVFGDLNASDVNQVNYFLHFAEGSVQPLFFVMVLLSTALRKAPFILRPVISGFVSAINKTFLSKEIEKQLEYLEGILEENSHAVKDNEPLYLVKNKFSVADIILSFNLFMVFHGSERFGNLALNTSDYPLLNAFVKHIESRPALKSADQRVLKEGKGKFEIYAS